MKNLYIYEVLLLMMMTLVKMLNRNLRIAIEMLETMKEVLQITKKNMVKTEYIIRTFVMVIAMKMMDLMMSNSMSVIMELIKIAYRIATATEMFQLLETTLLIMIIFLICLLDIVRTMQMSIVITEYIAMIRKAITAMQKNAVVSISRIFAKDEHLLSISGWRPVSC